MITERKSYSSNKFQLELPYLIEVQKASYEQFLQKEIPQEKRLKVYFPHYRRQGALLPEL